MSLGNELWAGVGAGERGTGMTLEEIVLELEIAGLAGLRLLPGRWVWRSCSGIRRSG